MPYELTRGVHRFIDEELEAPHQTTGHRAKQVIPRRDILAAAEAKRQAEAQASARNLRSSTRLPPAAYPHVRQKTARREDDELYEDEELYTQRPPRSAVRYQPEEEIYQSGNTHVYAGQVVIPKRRSAPTQQPPAQQYQQERYTEGIDVEVERPRGYRRPTPPWYLLLAIGAVLALTIWISGAWVTTWWTDTQKILDVYASVQDVFCQ
jgi:hypothetical protein